MANRSAAEQRDLFPFSLVLIMTIVVPCLPAQAQPDEPPDLSELLQQQRAAIAPQQHREIAETALAAVEQSMNANDFTQALKFASLASQSAKRSGNDFVRFQVETVRGDLPTLAREYRKIGRVEEILTVTPEDPEANLELGRFTAFLKGNWEAGLPLLAKGSDEAIRTVAAADLRNPTDEAAQIQLARDWLAIAEEEKSSRHASGIGLRASHWLRGALRKGKDHPQWKELNQLAAECTLRYLTDMEELHVKEGQFPLGKYGDTGFKRKIILDEIEFKDGLGLHPPKSGHASVFYQLDGQYKSLTAGVGIAEHHEGVAGPVVFTVLGDNRVLWRSGPFDRRNVIQMLQVKLNRIKMLELRTETTNTTCYGSHAVWLNPSVSK